MGLDQNALDSSLSIFGFIVHLLMLGKLFVISSRLFSWSYLVIYVSRHLTGLCLVVF